MLPSHAQGNSRHPRHAQQPLSPKQRMRIHELKRRLREAGAGPSHEQRILRLWSHALPRNSGRRLPGTFFPSSLLEALPSIEAELVSCPVNS